MRYVVVSLVTGLLFGILDGIINGNSLARRLHASLAPAARKKLKLPAGLAIDLAYGFLMTALFMVLRDSLPGTQGAVQGLSFAVLAWLFRVLMGALSQWMSLELPARALAYDLAAGLAEMGILGLAIGLGMGDTGAWRL